MRVGIELLRLQIGEPRPQPLRPVLRIVVEALAVLAAEPAALLDHASQQRFLLRVDAPAAEIGFGRLARSSRPRSSADLVVERERADRHAGHARDVLDHRRRHALQQHQVAFAHVVEHAAIGVEAARVVDHDRRLADRAHEIERRRERRVAGFLAEDDLDQHHALDRREEMNADEAAPDRLNSVGERRDRQRRGVGGEDRRLAPITACAFLMVSALTLRSSNTASITRSQSFSAP